MTVTDNSEIPVAQHHEFDFLLLLQSDAGWWGGHGYAQSLGVRDAVIWQPHSPRSSEPLPRGLGKGVYSPGLEIESVTTVHLLLARIQPHGHNHGQGSLGHNV